MKLSTETVRVKATPKGIASRRICFGILVLLLPFLGLGVRANTKELPASIAPYIPDTLWALLVFALIVSVVPHLRTPQAASVALGFAFVIECSQLYQAPWLNSLRATRIGGLVLGFGFLWSDLLCYAVGILVGVIIDFMLHAVQLNRKVRL